MANFRGEYVTGQKAPSAIRCIKTERWGEIHHHGPGQKAPSAIRCIKTAELFLVRASGDQFGSEST